MTDTIPFGQIVQFRKGKKAHSVQTRPVNGAKPYIQIDEVRGAIPKKFAYDPNGVEIRADDLCIVWDGANAGTVGYGIEGLIGSTVTRMRLLQPEKWDTPFVGRLLQSKFLELNEQAHGRGATIPHVNRAKLDEILLPCISRDAQHRIATILSNADRIRGKRLQVLSLADEVLKSTFLERFGDPLTNRKGLRTAPIKQLGRVVTGNTPSRTNAANFGSAIEWIKSDNINTPSHFVTRAEEFLSETGRSLGRTVPAGSTLVTCIAGSPSVIGNAALTDREVAFNQQINAVIPFKETDPHFLYCQFLVGKELVQASSTNSMKGMVSKGKFQEIEFLKPSQGEQEEFGELFRTVVGMTRQLRAACAESQKLFGSLSNRAFRGEL